MRSNAPALWGRGWKSIVGLIYSVLAIVLYLLARLSLFELAVLLGIGIILV